MISAAPLRSGVTGSVLLLRRSRAFLSAMCMAGFMAGCASPAKQILTSANGYHYYHARYQEACPSRSAPADLCSSWYAGLSRWHKRLNEANDALQRGGKLPLQLRAVKKSEKEAKKWTP